jgi:hypothetical protein
MQKREGLRGNPALYEANRKQQAAKEQAEYETLLESPLRTPPAGTPTTKVAGAQEKTHPPSTVAKSTTRSKKSSKASLATKLEYSSTSSEDANTAE